MVRKQDSSSSSREESKITVAVAVSLLGLEARILELITYHTNGISGQAVLPSLNWKIYLLHLYITFEFAQYHWRFVILCSFFHFLSQAKKESSSTSLTGLPAPLLPQPSLVVPPPPTALVMLLLPRNLVRRPQAQPPEAPPVGPVCTIQVLVVPMQTNHHQIQIAKIIPTPWKATPRPLIQS